MQDEMIVFRQARTDSHAALVAQGMTNAGANVFSIVWRNDNAPFLYVVFAKYTHPVTVNEIDASVDKLYIEWLNSRYSYTGNQHERD
jgi:hypothetical protein